MKDPSRETPFADIIWAPLPPSARRSTIQYVRLIIMLRYIESFEYGRVRLVNNWDACAFLVVYARRDEPQREKL